MLGLLRTARRLREIGLVGIGERNADFVLRYNPRKFYPRVDDKLITKHLAIEAGLPGVALRSDTQKNDRGPDTRELPVFGRYGVAEDHKNW